MKCETKRNSRSIRSSKTENHRVVEEGFESSRGSKRSWFVTFFSTWLEANSRRWWQKSIESKTSSPTDLAVCLWSKNSSFWNYFFKVHLLTDISTNSGHSPG
jgi:hypothetical protein